MRILSNVLNAYSFEFPLSPFPFLFPQNLLIFCLQYEFPLINCCLYIVCSFTGAPGGPYVQSDMPCMHQFSEFMAKF